MIIRYINNIDPVAPKSEELLGTVSYQICSERSGGMRETIIVPSSVATSSQNLYIHFFRNFCDLLNLPVRTSLAYSRESRFLNEEQLIAP